jgi:hypothetical protein
MRVKMSKYQLAEVLRRLILESDDATAKVNPIDIGKRTAPVATLKDPSLAYGDTMDQSDQKSGKKPWQVQLWDSAHDTAVSDQFLKEKTGFKVDDLEYPTYEMAGSKFYVGNYLPEPFGTVDLYFTTNLEAMSDYDLSSFEASVKRLSDAVKKSYEIRFKVWQADDDLRKELASMQSSTTPNQSFTARRIGKVGDVQYSFRVHESNVEMIKKIAGVFKEANQKIRQKSEENISHGTLKSPTGGPGFMLF